MDLATIKHWLVTKPQEIHSRNVEAGWWTDIKTGKSMLLTRNRPEVLMLQISELSEADYGAEMDCADDKLPQYDMFDVELIDVLIRDFDLLGAELEIHGPLDYDLSVHYQEFEDAVLISPWRWFNIIANECSAAMEHLRKGRTEQYRIHLYRIALAVLAVCNANDVKIEEVFEAKLNFNANRADHKIENRLLEFGKKF